MVIRKIRIRHRSREVTEPWRKSVVEAEAACTAEVGERGGDDVKAVAVSEAPVVRKAIRLMHKTLHLPRPPKNTPTISPWRLVVSNRYGGTERPTSTPATPDRPRKASIRNRDSTISGPCSIPCCPTTNLKLKTR